LIRENKHRLEREFYQGEVTSAFTICVKDKKELFANTTLFETFERILLEELSKQNFDAQVYLFMPDHVHMVITGKTQTCNSLDLIKLFKQKTGYWLSKNFNTFEWQKDFYDHIIRNESDIRNQIYYILENPIRKELVKSWKEFKLKGSTIYNLDELER
jgi:putative transposase